MGPAQPSAPRLAVNPPIDLDLAARYFAEAEDACRSDAGRLWGHSLCGPMLLVDPNSRFVVANRPAGTPVLTAQVRVHIGTLPPGTSLANTAFEWAGVRWSEVLWPSIPQDPRARKILFIHELFHRIQPQLGARMSEADNGHLASVDGRWLMRLEWRALGTALARDGVGRTEAMSDALAFRAARRRQFPGAAAAEAALESNEGLAEYTAQRVVGASDDERRALARASLATAEAKPSYVRSFAYGSGPAYGVLLDHTAVDWCRRALAGDDLGDLLARAAGISPANDTGATRSRVAAYDGDAVRREEAAREAAHERRVAELRARLIDGPTLTLPGRKLQLNFNPNELEPLGDAGTAYPTLRASDAWGELVVTLGGALVDPGWSKLVVTAPRDPSARLMRGDGWELHVAPGWTLQPGTRPGDWILRGPP